MKSKAQDWYRRLDPPPEDWRALQALLHLKYGLYDENELRTKMDVVWQEPKQRVQLYYNKLERFFVKGHILDVERRRQSMSKLCPELRKLLVVCTYQNMDEFLSTTIKVEKVLGEIGETPYEPLHEEREEELD